MQKVCKKENENMTIKNIIEIYGMIKLCCGMVAVKHKEKNKSYVLSYENNIRNLWSCQKEMHGKKKCEMSSQHFFI